MDDAYPFCLMLDARAARGDFVEALEAEACTLTDDGFRTPHLSTVTRWYVSPSCLASPSF